MRSGLTGWPLLSFAFVAKQYRLHGYISDSTVFIAIVQGYYVLERQYSELSITGMMDIVADGLDFMLSYGDIVWVPFMYSAQCRYLSTFPIHLSWICITVLSVALTIVVYIFQASKNQKSQSRKTPNDPRVANLPFLQTRKGTRLLTGGWWGISRHINYLGDWMQAITFCFSTGLAGSSWLYDRSKLH